VDPLCDADKAKDDAWRRLDKANLDVSNFRHSRPNFDPEAQPDLTRSDAFREKENIDQFARANHSLPRTGVAEAENQLREYRYRNSLPALSAGELTARLQRLGTDITELETKTAKVDEVRKLKEEIGNLESDLRTQMPNPNLESPASIEQAARRKIDLSPPKEGLIYNVDAKEWSEFVNNELVPLVNSKEFDNPDIQKARADLLRTLSNDAHHFSSDQRDIIRNQLNVLEAKIAAAQSAVRAKVADYRTKKERYYNLDGNDVLIAAEELKKKRDEKSKLDGMLRNEQVLRLARNAERRKELVEMIDWWEDHTDWKPKADEQQEAKD
jgi:hypothetical protein